MLAALCIVLSAIPRQATAGTRPPARFVVFVVTAARYQDLADPTLPSFFRLLETSSSGLMSVRVGRARRILEGTTTSGRLALEPQSPTSSNGLETISPVESGFVTLGAGNLAASTDAGRLAYTLTETVAGRSVGRAYRRLTGRDTGAAAIAHLGIEELLRISRSSERGGRVGVVGDALHEAGLRTAALGNSDGECLHREAALICVDGSGLVDLGDVSSAVTGESPYAPFGLTADTDALMSSFRAAIRQARLVVVDCGETGRASRYGPLCTESRARALKLQALRKTDTLLGLVMRELDPGRDRLLVLAPGIPSMSEDEPGAMSPIAMWGRGVPRGVLLSASTRRAGVVSNVDVAPTALDFLGAWPFVRGRGTRVQRGAIAGRPIEGKRWESPVEFNLAADQRMTNQMAGLVVARGAAVAQIAMIALCLYLASLARATWRRAVKWPALAPIAIMLGLLWSGASVQNVFVWPAVAFVSTVLLLVAAGSLTRSPADSALLLMLTAAASIAIDALRGSPLMSSSVLGFLPAMGSRYYGLGNEMMGLLVGCWIGASVMLAYRVSPDRRLILLAVSSISLVFITGMPFLGANFGGALAAAAGSVAAVGLAGGSRGWRLCLWLGIAGAAALGAGIGFDIARGGSSHIGRAFQSAAQDGGLYLWDIAARKLSMNLMLLQTSLWSKLLWAYVGAGALVLALPGSARLLELRANPAGRAAIAAMVVAALAALVFNDSGVLAAATCLAPAWVVLMSAAPTAAEGQTPAD